MNYKSSSGFVVGLIGAILCFIASITGLLCASACAAAGALTGIGGGLGVIVYIVLILGPISALVGSILCLKKSTIGGILLLLSVILSVVRIIVAGFSVLGLIAGILLLIGAILAFAVKQEI